MVPDSPSVPAENEEAESGSDHALIRQFCLGDSEAATELYRRYSVRLKCLAAAQLSPGLALRVEPEDLVQSVFAAFFRRASEGGYDVPPGEDLWQLLVVIMLNKIRNQAAFCYAAKRNNRITEPLIGLGDSSEYFEPQTEELTGFFELVVRDALEQLPPGHRQAVEFRLQGYEVSEVAARLHRSLRTVERMLKEAREILRLHLLEENQ